MQKGLVERARAALADLAYEVRTGDGRALKDAESLPPVEEAPVPFRRGRGKSLGEKPITFSKHAEWTALCWENERLRVWRSAGRLTPEGVLRVGTDPLAPYTQRDVAQLLPHLPALDRLAALIDLDGVVEANFMGNPEHEYIRTVVEKIADERVAKALHGRDETIQIRDLIRQEVGTIFSEMIGAFGQKLTPQLGGTAGKGQRKCGKCGALGHMKSTCQATSPVAPDKWACIHCTNLAGKPLSDSVTHPVPPKQFHQGDPSFVDAE